MYDLEEAASRLTEKLVEMLNKHAPWIIFQEKKNFSPWVTGETLELMKQRDKFKEKVKAMASREVSHRLVPLGSTVLPAKFTFPPKTPPNTRWQCSQLERLQ